MARPKKDITEEQVYDLASINCSYEEMAHILDCDQSLLTKRFSQVIQKGRSNCKMSLKRMQYRKAEEGSVPMLIWMGKVVLGQREQVEHIHNEPRPKPEGLTDEVRNQTKELLDDDSKWQEMKKK